MRSETTPTRLVRAVLAAGALLTLLAAACVAPSDGGKAPAAPVIPNDFPTSSIEPLLPSEHDIERLVGLPVDVATRLGPPQSFEHTDRTALLSASYALFRAAAPEGSGWLGLLLYETEEAAEDARRVVASELGSDGTTIRDRFAVSPLDSRQDGAVIDADTPFTWGLVRFGRLLVDAAVFHTPQDDGVIPVQQLVEDIARQLALA